MEDSTTVEAWLRDWFRQRAPDVALEPGDNYFDKEIIDSFGAIELIEDLESQFAVRFSEVDFQDRRFATLGGLVAIIGEKKG